MQIKLSVTDPEARKQYGGIKQFYIYTIQGTDQKGTFQIQRRYSDFELLRSTILKRWPGYFIPSLPSKLKIGHSDDDFLQIRSMYLQKFLQEIAKQTIIWYSEQTQFFIRVNNLPIEKVMGNYSKVDYSELIFRYSADLKSYEQNPQKHKQSVELFQKQLQSLYLKVQELRVKYEEIYNAEARYQRKYGKLLNHLLVGYQNRVRHLQQKDSLILNQQNKEQRQKLSEALKEVPLQALFEEIKRQKRQILAFQEIIHSRGAYQKQMKEIESKIKQKQAKIESLRGGKQSFLSKVRGLETSSQIESLQKSIGKYRQELGKVKQVYSFVNYVLAEQQIGLFKQERISSYYRMVRNISEEQLKIINAERQFWVHLAQECSFQIQQQPKQHHTIIKDKAEPTTNSKQIQQDVGQRDEVQEKPQRVQLQQQEDFQIGTKEQVKIEESDRAQDNKQAELSPVEQQKEQKIQQQVGQQSVFSENKQQQQKVNQSGPSVQSAVKQQQKSENLQIEQIKQLQAKQQEEQS